MKNRLQVIFFLMMLFVVYFLTKEYWDGKYIGAFSLVFSLSAMFIGFVIFFENRHPTQTLTWIVVLGSFPVVGFFFYLLFGKNYRKKRKYEKKAMLDQETFLKYRQIDEEHENRIGVLGEQKLVYRLAQRLSKSPISFSSETHVLTNGEETFREILHAIKQAKHHIHLEYYIVRHDGIGHELKNLLIEKAQQGIEVRFLFDAVGSWKLSKDYVAELRDAGVEMVAFSPVRLPFLNNNINFRNHRKIVVIDGNVAFMGGLNVGDEYLGKNDYFGFWRDTHLKLTGEVVRTLQLIFLQDWYYMTGKVYLRQTYLQPATITDHGLGGVQCIAGGPDNELDTIKHLFFAMIMSARKSIWIASPYFIPDDDITSALKVAALSGVDVRILMPHRPDKKIVFYASRSYFPELMAAGVKVYEYKKGFLHSKILLVDGEMASIGTANMDMRSFHLNFEVNAFLYRTDSVKKLEADFLQDYQDSHLLDLDQFQNRPVRFRVYESTCRLLSPLL